jgi:hypothetical protein
MKSKNIILQKKNFYKRLKLLGFENYNSYLKSSHWKLKKKEYIESNFKQSCIICNNNKYVLHHRSYVRLGDESLHDFVPLCNKHHNELHEFCSKNKLIFTATHKAIRIISGMNKKETRNLFKKINIKGGKWKDKKRIDILTNK